MLETFANSLLVIRNVLYFVTGGWLFFMVAASLPKSRKFMNSNTEVIVYIFCCFVVWCWIYSKLIAL